MKKFYLILILSVVALSIAFAVQQDRSNVEIKATKIAGSVYMLEGSGGNIGISIGEDGVLMVDDQFADLADRIKAAIKGIGGDAPKYILNTHYHGDHTGGNAEFGATGILVAHENVRKRLGMERVRGDRTSPARPREEWPVITFNNSLSLHFNGEEIKAMHYPRGHTDGDAVIYFTGSNVVHMGDDFFANRFPFVDLDSGGSVEGLIANITRISAELPADVKIIPGHGPISSVDDLNTYLNMLRETSAIVKEQAGEGKDLEEIKANGLPDKYASWGSGFINHDRWIETIFRSNSQAMSSK